MTRKCFDVPIVNDRVSEHNEVFEISARFVGSVTVASTTVTIVDDDGKMHYYTYLYAPIENAFILYNS